MRYFILFLFLGFNLICFSQVSTESEPKSFSIQEGIEIPIHRLNEFDIDAFLQEDERDQDKLKPYRFANPIEVNLDMTNSGLWTILEDGSKIWRLIIQSPDAYSLNLIYDIYNIPTGAEFFLYSEDKSMIIGAFTDYNHKPHGGFSTAPVKGETIILEYNEPANVEFTGQISISTISHAYRDVFFNDRGYGDSGSCNNNVICNEGDNWRDEIRSVAMILTSGGSRICTGSLVNNARQDLTPYFLTANHCLGGNDSWIFMFNYDSPTCTNQNGPTNMTVSGSSLLSSGSTSDFAILELNETPPESYNIHYAGWSAEDIAPQQPVAIHHPSGDIKKISFDYDNGISNGWSGNDGSHWQVADWEDGTTEPGSSGSPLFDSNHRIVGQLHGGEASCSYNVNDYYGKVSTSWGYGLQGVLDPDNTGITTLDGMDAIDLPDPIANYSVGDLNFELENGQTASSNISISNDGEAESVLNYNFKISPFSVAGSAPDNAGYWWTDSELNNHINSNWVDISGNSTLIEFQHNDQAGDPINIGFDFPFYGESYSQCIVNANGWIGFGADNSSWENIDIPSTTAPRPAIFPFWDDLNPVNDACNSDCSGNVYYYSDSEKFVVWFNDVAHWTGTDYSGTTYDFQVVMSSNGKIEINYNTITGNYSPTIGIQNATGTIGQKITYENIGTNSGWVNNDKTLLFSLPPNWVGLNTLGNHSYTGELFEGTSNNVNIVIENTNLPVGEYTSFLDITSNGGQSQSFEITLNSTENAGIIGDLNQDEEINVIDVVLLVNTILDGSTDPYILWSGDLNQDDNLNVLDIVQLVNVILGN